MADNPVAITKIKGDPAILFPSPGYGAVSPAADKLSDGYVDCSNYNAVSVTVYVPAGFTVSATVAGSPDPQGIYLTLPDSQATQSALTASKVFDVTVGQRYVKVKLSGITVPGGNPANNGIVVVVTPYDAAGQSNISVTATANQNLTEVGGAAITLGQKAMASSIPVTLASDETAPISATQLPAALGQAAMASSLPVAIASNQSTVPVNAVAAATGGDTPTLKRNLGSTVTAIKASAGNLAGLQILNNQAAAAFIQIFDAATGSVTLATTVPVLEIMVPATSMLCVPLPPEGLNFATAISIASTTTEFGSIGSAAGVHVNAQYA